VLQPFPSSFQLIHERLKLGIVSDPIKARVTRKERIIGHAFADAHPQPLHGLRGVSRERENSGDSGTARSENPVTVWLLCKPASGHRPGARPDYRFQQQHECGEIRGEGGSDAVKWERVQQIEKLKREGLTIRAAH